MSVFRVGDRIRIKEEYVPIHCIDHSRYGVIIEISSWHYVKMDDCKCGFRDITEQSAEDCCIGFKPMVIEKDHTTSKEYKDGAEALRKWLET